VKDIRICSECEDEFDLHSPEKIKAGGKTIHCSDCSQETAVEYLAVGAGDGKGNSLNILAFSSEEDRNKYKRYWDNISGKHKGKVASLSKTAMTDPGIKFSTITQDKASNHKGKA